jgi:phosphoribosylformylglycinamidine cyclo-ligase
MLRTFNCGIGMIVAADAGKAAEVEAALSAVGEAPVRLGEIVPLGANDEPVAYRGKLTL